MTHHQVFLFILFKSLQGERHGEPMKYVPTSMHRTKQPPNVRQAKMRQAASILQQNGYTPPNAK